MITSWMFGATLLALLLGIAAMAMEHALRIARKPGRWPWTMALVAALVWPPLAGPVVRALESWRAQPIVFSVKAAPSMATIVADQLPTMAELWSARLNSALLVAWIVISVIMLARLLAAAWSLSRAERLGRAEELDGESVLVTESLGPAVVGLFTPRIAVPSWLMELDASLRTMVLRHEREHCRMRDPQLMWLSAMSVALMPWNPGVWWMSRRLRLALEIDCDARTLLPEANHASYGKLLLLIAQRQSGERLAPMLAESTSHLTQRINAMQRPPIRRPLLRVMLFGAVAAGAIALACSPRLATDLTTPKPVARPALTKTTTPGDVFFEFQVEKPVVGRDGGALPVYPPALKTSGVEGIVFAQFVVDEAGLPETNTFKVLQSSRQEFTDAVREALPNMRFVAASIGGKSVKQLVQQPFMFSVSGKSEVTDAATLQARRADTAMIRLRRQLNGELQVKGVPLAKTTSVTPAEIGVPRDLRDLKPKEVTGQSYKEFQVEQPVKALAGSAMPHYPDELKAAGIEGTVFVQFVVDTNGVPLAGSLKVLKSSNPAFTDAVRAVFPDLRFEPARVGDRAVRQLMQTPFTFSLSSPPAKP